MKINKYLLTIKNIPAQIKYYFYMKNSGKHVLPDGYEQLEYIESTGTQYIDTGYIPDSNTKIDIKFMGIDNTANVVPLFGGRTTTETNTYTTFYKAGSKGRVDYGNYTSSNPIIQFINGKIHTFVKDKEKNYLDDEYVNSNTSMEFSCSYPLYINNINTAGTPSATGLKAKLYYTKIYDNNKLVRDLVPALKKSNGNQLFDYTRTDGIIADKYINQAGAIVSSNDYYLSYPISVTPGETYTWRFNADSSSTTHTAPTVGFYDINNNLIGTAQHGNQIKYFNFTVPSNCAYIRCSVYTVNNAQIQAMLNKGSTPLRYEPYIPDVAGMYDFVNNTFYTNSGTGEFIYQS